MKLPKGLPNDVVLRTWMADGKGGSSNMKSSSFVSPMWKQSSEGHCNVVTLTLRPFRTTNLSLDSFMASHSPRRNCGNKQKFMLKPLDLDQRNVSSNIHRTFGRETMSLSMASSSMIHEQLVDNKEKPERPYSNCSQGRERKMSASVVTLGDYNHETSKQFVSDSLYTFKNNSFRPSPRFSQTTGQKISIGNTFGFNYHTGYLNLLKQQAELVATGTPVSTVGQKHETQAKTIPRWQSKPVVSDKGSKYPDPMIAASPSFKARMSEISQYELDTIKWEKSKKVRKKHSSSS